MSPAARIVSLVPSTTESVCELGAAARLVGCTRYCTEPRSDLAGKVRVGGTKNPSLERIARLRPDLVLGNAEENRPEDLAWLRARFPVLEQTPCTVVEATQSLRDLAVQLDAQEALQPFLLRIEAQLAAAAVANIDRRPLRAFYAVWPKPWMGVNGSTFVHDVLRIAGATNVCANAVARYPEVTPDEVRAAAPEIVLLPDEPWEFKAGDVGAFAQHRLFGEARLALCSGRDFCWHGTRMADGLGRATALVQGLRG